MGEDVAAMEGVADAAAASEVVVKVATAMAEVGGAMVGTLAAECTGVVDLEAGEAMEESVEAALEVALQAAHLEGC